MVTQESLIDHLLVQKSMPDAGYKAAAPGCAHAGRVSYALACSHSFGLYLSFQTEAEAVAEAVAK